MAVSPPRVRSILFLPSSHRQCRQCLSLQISRIDKWLARGSRIDLLVGKQEDTITEIYVFRGSTGHAEMVTDDKSGKKLPSHPFGEWVFSRTIDVVTGTRLTGGVDCRQVL